MGLCTFLVLSLFRFLPFISRTSHELRIFLFRDLLFVLIFVHCFKVSFQISAPDHPGGIEPLAPWPCSETLPLSYGPLPGREQEKLDQTKIICQKTLQKVVAIAECSGSRVSQIDCVPITRIQGFTNTLRPHYT